MSEALLVDESLWIRLRPALVGFGFIFLQGAKALRLGLSDSSDSLGRSSCSWPEVEEENDNLAEDMDTDSLSESLNSGRFNEDEHFVTEKLHLPAGTPLSSGRKQGSISIVGQDLVVLMDLELTIREKLISWKHGDRIFEPELKLTSYSSILDLWFNKICRLRPTSLGSSLRRLIFSAQRYPTTQPTVLLETIRRDTHGPCC
ncbi:hypothetical protein F3Y22_tig00005294pilonHSYRG00059 [Hibiscus syriacus]|uniref:Uncharacterized protein n=1 Tax=Hibiscus syriacus TaxID=106335 RepID=A0A6A3CF04_HIBSY|nr:hypothetical protein F3Y22_tig00005294pilonHSYRG00059 [Hibiscus syriacus]